MSVVMGADIGGSHITAALVDLETRSLIKGSSKRKLIDSSASAELILKEWCDVITEVLGDRAVEGMRVGIAMPGPFDYEKGISLIKDQDKFRALYKMDLKEKLAGRLGMPQDQIRFMNDAACFLQGEAFCGAARKFNQVLGLTLGTGLGSAFCKDGIAEDADLWKSLFKESIAEDYLSTRWFVKRCQELSGRTISGVKELIEEGLEDVRDRIFLEFGENLGLFLLPYIEKFNAEGIVLGGNISKAESYFLSSLQSVLTGQGINIQIKKAMLNEEAALLGASSCWKMTGRKKSTAPGSVMK